MQYFFEFLFIFFHIFATFIEFLFIRIYEHQTRVSLSAKKIPIIVIGMAENNFSYLSIFPWERNSSSSHTQLQSARMMIMCLEPYPWAEELLRKR